MKKIAFMLVILFVAMVANAQVVVHSDAIETVLSNGVRYRSMDLPGTYKEGVDFSSQFNINMQSVAQREGQTAYQEALWKAQNARTEVVDLSRYVRNNTGVGMTGMYGMTGMGMGIGMGYGMYGTNTGAGMVGGQGGMAGATSSVHIDNSNMISTVGSGLNMQYNTGTNSISISGDPLMAIGRVVAGIGGSKKKSQQTTNGGVQVIYVDAATGRQYQQPVQQVQPQVQYQQQQPQVQYQQQPVQYQQQRQQQSTTTNVGAATSSNYDVSSGF